MDEPVTFRTMFEEPSLDEEAARACPHCGQRIDHAALVEILHHRQPNHEPLAPGA